MCFVQIIEGYLCQQYNNIEGCTIMLNDKFVLLAKIKCP